MVELKTNSAQTKIIVRAQAGGYCSWEQGEKEKSWRGFIELRYWGMGVQVRYAREGLFGKVGRPWAWWDERLIGIGPAVKLLKTRLEEKSLFHFILLLVCSFSHILTPSIVKIINWDKHESLVFVPFQSPLLGLVLLLVLNSEYTMKMEVVFFYYDFLSLN